VTYTLNAADEAIFNIDSSGNLSFDVAPDFETDPTSYNVAVMATANGETSVAQVAVSVVNDDGGPTGADFTSEFPAGLNVGDLLSNVPFFSISGVHPDPNEPLTYSLAPGSSPNFTISGNLVSFAPGVVANATNSYGTYTVVVTDSDGDVYTSPLLGTMPVLIDLDGDGHEITQIDYDFDGDGEVESGGFTGPDDAVLAIDINLDGEVNGVEEIALADLTDEEDTDLEALGTLIDENGDGLVDANDSGFDSLLLWQDINQDGIAQDSEVSTLVEAGIESIAVEYLEGSEAYSVDGLANILGESAVTFTDGTTTTAADAELIYSDAYIDFSTEAEGSNEADDLEIALASTADASAETLSADDSVAVEIDPALLEMSGNEGSDDWLI